MRYETEIVITIDDLADELFALGDITEGEKDRLAAYLFFDYSNDSAKRYGLDWDLEILREDVERMRNSNEDIKYIRMYEVMYTAQRFLQNEFPDKDEILIDVSW